MMGGYELDSSGPGWRRLAGRHERSNETSGSIKGGIFLD